MTERSTLPRCSNLPRHIGLLTMLLITLLSGYSPATKRAVGGDDGAKALAMEVRSAMRRAANYYDQRVCVRGGYVYHYTLDLKTRWGEGLAGEYAVWVQPPGTPTVGMAMLSAYEATGDPFYLDCARRAAEAMAYGQLRSGGWTNQVDLANFHTGQPYQGGRRQRDGNSSLDDGQTQSALQLVMRVDEALRFKNQRIHDAAMQGVRELLGAQFPNGAFPQVWSEPAKSRVLPKETQAIVRANYPSHDWRTEGRIKEYWDMYTLNDNVCGYVTDTLWDAHRIYRSDAAVQALRRLGDFLLLAQMPDPQPGWAQQYNYAMQPIWARRFEPAAVAGDETQEAVATLMRIAALTREPKYLQPIPTALDYLERSLLPDGQIARYYELRTNKPLYMKRKGKQYSLTYDDSRLPRHYGWKMPAKIKQLRADHQTLKQELASGTSPSLLQDRPVSEKQARALLARLDDQFRWVSTYRGERLVGQPKFRMGEQYLSSERFSENITTLARWLQQHTTDSKGSN